MLALRVMSRKGRGGAGPSNLLTIAISFDGAFVMLLGDVIRSRQVISVGRRYATGGWSRGLPAIQGCKEQCCPWRSEVGAAVRKTARLSGRFQEGDYPLR
jgi:hypothetical protein